VVFFQQEHEVLVQELCVVVTDFGELGEKSKELGDCAELENVVLGSGSRWCYRMEIGVKVTYRYLSSG